MKFLALIRIVLLLLILLSSQLQVAAAPKGNSSSPLNNETLSGGIVHNEGVYLPRGLIVPVELKTPIDTRINQLGDQITAQVTEDVLLGDYVIIPANSFVHGYISDLTAADKKFKAPKVNLEFDTISLPGKDGQRRYVHIKGVVRDSQIISSSKEVTDESKTYKAKAKKAKMLGALGGALFLHGVTRSVPDFTVMGITALSKFGYLGMGAIGGAMLASSLITKDDIRAESGTKLTVLLSEPTVESFDEKSLLSHNMTRNVDAKVEEAGVMKQPLKDAGADITAGEAYDQLATMQAHELSQ